MARKFERGPQGVTNPNRGDGPDSEEQFSALLSRILSSTQDVAESTAATRTVSVVSYTTPVSDNGAFFTATMGSDNVFGIASSTADSFTTSYYYSSSSSSSTGPGTTIARPTSSSTLTAYGQQQTSLPGPTETSLSTAQNSGNANDNNGGGELSTGQLVAVIVVPIAVAALVVLLAVLVFRRRRERDGSRQQHARPDDSSGISSNNKTNNNNNQGSGAIFGLREKWGGSRRSSASSQQQQQQQQQPIRLEVTSHYNNSYMTGLDTSSRSSSLQDDEPPPYPFDITHTAAPSPRRLSRRLTDLRPQKMTRLQIPQHHPTSTSTTTTMLAPIPPVSPLLPRFLSPSPSFLHEQHRPGTSPSINSDVYSDNASIHSARAARMSIGSPTMILHRGGTHHSDSPRGSTGDPFDDPDSPVGRSRQGSAASQASDVSKGLDV